MKKQPHVSVVMAIYNEPENIIRESVSSILNQTYDNIELLIADDSTNEKTIKIIDQFAAQDNRIVVIRKPERMGFVNALNEGLRQSKGEYIARMDGDDISLPDRIERQIMYSVEHPDIDVFGGDMCIIDENGIIKSERHYPITARNIKKMFIFRSPFAHPTLMFKRRIVDEGYYYNPAYKKAEDVDFLFRLYGHGYKFGNIGEEVLRYRVIGNLQNKRSKEQWIYNHKARSENFIWSMPFFSIASWLVSLAYKYIPSSFVSYIYKRENRKCV